MSRVGYSGKLGGNLRGSWKEKGKLDNRPIEELMEDVKPKASPPGKVHIDDWLLANGVKPWQRGGKRAYALKKGLEFATDSQFVVLFANY